MRVLFDFSGLVMQFDISYCDPSFPNFKKATLAGVAQWTECQTMNESVAGLIPSQGTYLDSWPGPQ